VQSSFGQNLRLTNRPPVQRPLPTGTAFGIPHSSRQPQATVHTMLYGIFCIMTIFLLLELLKVLPFLIGVLFTAFLFDKTRRGQAIALGIVFVPVTALNVYLYHWDDLVTRYHHAKFKRACRRAAREELPVQPIEARGLELRASFSAPRGQGGCMGECAKITDPIYYLGRNGGPRFEFVDHQGKRYTGLPDNYAVHQSPTLPAPYAVSYEEQHKDGRVESTMSVVDTSTQKRVAYRMNYRFRFETCPAATYAEDFLSRVIMPAPKPYAPPPAPAWAHVVQARRREGSPTLTVGDKPNLHGISGAGVPCANVEHAGALASEQPLLLKDGQAMVTIYPSIAGIIAGGHILDVTCQGEVVLALVRGRNDAAGLRHFLVRYAPSGRILGIEQIRFQADEAPEPRSGRSSDLLHARRLRWVGNEVSFTLFALDRIGRDRDYSVVRSDDYVVTLAALAGELP